MKRLIPPLRKTSLTIALMGLGAMSAMADIVYVTSTPSNCTSTTICGSLNQDFNFNTFNYVYTEWVAGAYTGANSVADGKPTKPGARYFSNAFSNATPDLGLMLNPALGVTGGVYKVYHVFTSTAGNVSTNIILGVTNNAYCDLSFTETDKFQRSFGALVSGKNQWQLLGFLTNAPDNANPIITFYFKDGIVNAGAQQRLIVDTFRFSLYEPCTDVAPVGTTGPLATNSTEVVVTGVTNATAVTVYQDSGAGMVKIGELTSGIVDGQNLVPVTGLIKDAQVAATQTVGGQEGCVPTTGSIVGGGANPSIRLALSIRENIALTGPAWSTSGSTNSIIYHLGASSILSGACPEDGVVIYPSNDWQTVTIQRGPDPFNPTNPAVVWNGAGDATLDGKYGGLDGFSIACEGDSGPLDFYIDSIENGTNGIVQGFEDAEDGTLAYQFRQPSLSGSTGGNLLSAPNESVVTSAVAYQGTKSLRIRYQYNSNATNKWLRLVTAGAVPVQNPQVDLDEPFTFRLLLLPPGVEPPQPPVPGPISIVLQGSDVVLDWSGSYQLQKATDVVGPYTDVTGVMTGPYTNAATGSAFYRLVNQLNP